MTVDEQDLGARWYELIDFAEAGGTVVVTRNGEPLVELRPVARGGPAQGGDLAEAARPA